MLATFDATNDPLAGNSLGKWLLIIAFTGVAEETSNGTPSPPLCELGRSILGGSLICALFLAPCILHSVHSIMYTVHTLQTCTQHASTSPILHHVMHVLGTQKPSHIPLAHLLGKNSKLLTDYCQRQVRFPDHKTVIMESHTNKTARKTKNKKTKEMFMGVPEENGPCKLYACE